MKNEVLFIWICMQIWYKLNFKNCTFNAFLFKLNFYWSKQKVHKDILVTENLVNNYRQTKKGAADEVLVQDA